MNQVKSKSFRMRARLVVAFLCLSLAIYAPITPPAHAAASVSSTPSTIVGRDFICILYYPYCLTSFLCCTNPYEILDGDIKNKQEPWFLGFFNVEILLRWKAMADQFTAVIVMHARMIGGFFDAQSHMEATLALQKLTAKALRDYQPDEALCRIGTASRSLGNSEMRGRRIRLMLSERSENRQILNKNSNAANDAERGREPGRAADKSGRLLTYLSTFCNKPDNDFVLASVCTAGSDKDSNRDIDYARTFETPANLDLKFSGTTPTDDLRYILALGSNLYAHNIVQNRPNPDMLDPTNKGDGVQRWMDYRSIIAKRSVAENSFNAITSMKMKGANASNQYLRELMKGLGLGDPEIDRLLGVSEPSYYAQMEILTKRMYQDPAFYANLMQTPTNVQRTQAAMKAIGLMQERDIADSLQRTEMLFSTLLEVQLARAQNKLMDKSAR